MKNGEHACTGLEQHKQIDAEAPNSINANGATADSIEKHDGRYFLIVNAWEYAIEIAYCPFCGIPLERATEP